MIRAFDKTDKHALRIAGDDLDRLVREASDWIRPGYDLERIRTELLARRTCKVRATDCKLETEIAFFYDPAGEIRDRDLRDLDDVGLFLAYYPTFKY